MAMQRESAEDYAARLVEEALTSGQTAENIHELIEGAFDAARVRMRDEAERRQDLSTDEASEPEGIEPQLVLDEKS